MESVEWEQEAVAAPVVVVVVAVLLAVSITSLAAVLLVLVLVLLAGTINFVTNKSESAEMESIPKHPPRESVRKCLWLQVFAIDFSVLLVSLGQSSRSKVFNWLCPEFGSSMWLLLLLSFFFFFCNVRTEEKASSPRTLLL